jgi:hypothetical protein
MKAFGVDVSLVEPGAYRSNIGNNPVSSLFTANVLYSERQQQKLRR